jgi:hypothetical protein
MPGKTGFLEILSITAPIFVIIAIGYAVVRYRIISRDGIRALAIFVVNFAVPALLFKTISERTVSEILHVDYLLAYGLGSLLTFFAVFVIARRARTQSLTNSSVSALGGSFSNTLMVGYPVTMALLGSAALVPFALSLLIENFLMMPLALALADIGRNRQKGITKTLSGVLFTWIRNPLLLAILLGVLFSLFELDTPAIAANAVDLLSKTVSGVGLFVIGGMLAGFNYTGRLWDISLIMTGKLIVHPLAVLTVFYFLPTADPMVRTAGVIIAAAPMLGIYAAIGQRYELGEFCAAALVPTTVVSFVTITAFIWLMAGMAPY